MCIFSRIVAFWRFVFEFAIYISIKAHCNFKFLKNFQRSCLKLFIPSPETLWYCLRSALGGIKCSTSFYTSDSLWWHSRPILRPRKTVSYGWSCTRYQLRLFRRLCRSRILQLRNIHSSFNLKGQMAWSYYPFTRKPWVTTNYASLWVLRRMFDKIRQC